MDTTGMFASYFAFWPDLIIRGQVWRLVTWVFYPASGGNIIFTAIALYFYFFIGSTLEREWGTPKFTIYYILGVLFNIIYGFAIYLFTGYNLPITPSYLNLSLFFAFAVLYPDQRVLLFFIIPVKIKWLALLDAAFFVVSMIMSLAARQYVAAFLPLVAVLNFLVFFSSDLISLLKPYKSRVSRQTIDFKKAARQHRQEEASRPYRHKCAVCGKTDTDNPTLEFRYCSRCNGYHCFCSEHINNHIHFQ
jgi:membrane associated rhomboid family serine protease